MNRKSLLIIILVASVAIALPKVCPALQAQSSKEIIEGSRNVIFKGIKPNEVKGFYLKKAVTVAENNQRFEMERELSVRFPF